MYIKKIELTDLRGFRRLDIRFDRKGSGYAGWWVITGDNGSGKTAVLKAIAMAIIGPDAIRSLQTSFRGWVHRSSQRAQVAVEIVTGKEDGFAKGRPYSGPFWSVLELFADEGPEVALRPGSKGGGKGPTHGPWAENPTGWFSLGYGPFRRLYGASPDAQRVMSGPERIARYATMYREDATLGECELWLKQLSFRSLEGKSHDKEILDTIIEILNDDFLQNGLRVERVDSEGLWLRQSNDIVLPLADMSEGYRSALAMLVDLLRHLVQAYGHSHLVERVAGKLTIPHSGVVLIDEVDAHLHPEWQRKIGFWFKERLPNVQFIVTTHSGLVLPAADEDAIFHLPSPGSDLNATHIKGDAYRAIIRGKPNEILRSPAFNLQHTLSPRAVEARIEYAELKAKERANRLNGQDAGRMKQLSLFVQDDAEEDEL